MTTTTTYSPLESIRHSIGEDIDAFLEVNKLMIAHEINVDCKGKSLPSRLLWALVDEMFDVEGDTETLDRYAMYLQNWPVDLLEVLPYKEDVVEFSIENENLNALRAIRRLVLHCPFYHTELVAQLKIYSGMNLNNALRVIHHIPDAEQQKKVVGEAFKYIIAGYKEDTDRQYCLDLIVKYHEFIADYLDELFVEGQDDESREFGVMLLKKIHPVIKNKMVYHKCIRALLRVDHPTCTWIANFYAQRVLGLMDYHELLIKRAIEVDKNQENSKLPIMFKVFKIDFKEKKRWMLQYPESGLWLDAMACSLDDLDAAEYIRTKLQSENPKPALLCLKRNISCCLKPVMNDVQALVGEHELAAEIVDKVKVD